MKCHYCDGCGEVTHDGLIDLATGKEAVSICWYCEGSGEA